MSVQVSRKNGWQLRDVVSLIMLTLFCLSIFEPAFAGAAFQKASDTVNEVQLWIVGVTVALVTIAWTWGGIKVMYGGASMRDITPLIGGGAIIGVAGTAAAFFVS